MADPRIKYDVLANAKGEEDVLRLADALDKVDDAIDPAAAARAAQLAEQLRQLGQQQAAIAEFTRLKRETEGARKELELAQGAVKKLATDIAAAGVPTRTQAGQLEKLKDAAGAAKREVQAKSQALDVARGQLTQVGIATDQLASAELKLRDSVKAARNEVAQIGEQGRAVTQFKALVAATDEARKRFEAADQAVESYRRTLGSTEAPTTAQVQNLQRLQQAARGAQQAFSSAAQAQAQAAGSLRTAGVDTERLAALQGRLPPALTATAAAARQAAGGYQQLGAAAASGAAAQVRAQGVARTAAEELSQTYRRLQGVAVLALGGGIFGSLIGDVSRTADEFANLQARVRILTGEGPAFEQFFTGVAEVADRTSASLQTTGDLAVRIAQTGAATQQQALALTETINQAVAVSGTTAASSDAAIRQLIQGLDSGVLRGEEFNSVVEQTPRLAQALADGLGIARGELRALAQDGQLTADVVIQALQNQSAAVQREFEQLPPTVGRAIQKLANNWTLYVGEVDQANGVSAKAAAVIEAMADNLDTLATVLLGVGKAAAAYKALQLAQTFLGIGSAAKVAAAGVSGLAAAQTAATTAGAAHAAQVSRFAALLGGLKTFTLIGLLTNLNEIGTAIGEGAAKLLGYGKVIEESEANLLADEKAARANAAAKAELAEQARKASEAALGLNKESRALVGEFDALERKGESTAAALEALGKSLDLGDIQGITDAAAALDVLALRGKITGDQVRDTLGAALKGLDLGTFRVQALAAFDGSEQGVRRLQAALDAISGEALRRAGSSLGELTTGFSEAATAAINDVDALRDTLNTLGADSATQGRLLGAALDKATAAANTERAVQAVIDRLEELGAQGKLSGDQLAAGLDTARKKLDDLKPGIDSLAEAYRQFGFKTKAELQSVADKNKAAWQTIRNDATLSLSQKQQAFKQYAESAIAANGGVADSQLKNEAAALKVAIQVDKTGKATVDAMDKAGKAVEQTTKRFNELGQEVNEYGDAINQAAGSISSGWEAATKARNEAVGANGFSDFDSADYRNNVTREGGSFQVDVPEGYYYTLDPNAPGVERRAGYTRSGQPIPGYFARLTPTGGAAGQGGTFGGTAGAPRSPGPSPAPAPAGSLAAAAGGAEPVETIRVVHEVAGRGYSSVMNAAEAQQFLAALAQAKASGG